MLAGVGGCQKPSLHILRYTHLTPLPPPVRSLGSSSRAALVRFMFGLDGGRSVGRCLQKVLTSKVLAVPLLALSTVTLATLASTLTGTWVL